MITRALTKDDFDHIVQVADRWAPGLSGGAIDPAFFYELGGLARVVEIEGMLSGFILAFIALSPAGSVGYVQGVAVHPDQRRRGVARVLYQTFEEECRLEGCVMMKAVAAPSCRPALAFHRQMGFGLNQVRNYAGAGRPRIEMLKQLPAAPGGQSV